MPPVGAAIYQVKPNKTGASVCFHAICRRAANEIKVSVEQRRLVISGMSEKTTEEKNEQTLLSEFRSSQFCRALRLPADVEPDKTAAALKDGVLELVFAKAAGSKAVDVEVRPE